ncbi:MAG: CD1871A family CXXC motif-containing protein [Sphaerochaetaceae bacterium]|jgi:hypothetical protein|nr:CD1871A family CXXC motif-containing protein [Sphaerochaetaceae bacterium]MDD3671655.1 CD1871A family CXXC motif-containing protein [Sphaerochaetaceae bacterium]MDD4258508.1 CD1871A family CXXC motif-containing protein [Sphaerochaetaceae bacterium]MDD4840376.1 CD1871A family CXXC motif-containing protein [Sphaerochaetaceae bacterium]NLO60062.1 hypothetical protein [Spirochaetales bacterium]
METSRRTNAKSSAKIAIILLILGGLLITVGIFFKEMTIVLQKATLICLECIGLG